MELKRITGEIYYIENPTNIGVIGGPEGAVLVDSGLDDDTGRRVLKLLDSQGMRPTAIINTHSHADHCGANGYIKEKTGATILAPEMEAEMIQSPLLEPLALFSFANPITELRNKFTMPRPSKVDRIFSSADARLRLGGIEVGVVPLPGHSVNQIGIEYGGVLFCGDSLLSEEILAKHRLPVNFDRETLRFLMGTHYGCYVPSHAQPVADIMGLAKANLAVTESLEGQISGIIRTPKAAEEVLREVCDATRMEIKGPSQYFVLRSVVLAYLSSMRGRGLAKPVMSENRLLWEGTGA